MRKKYNFPIDQIRRYLEPGPIVLVSSKWKEETNIMTMGWHTVMEFTPSLIGCVIAQNNHSFALIRNSKECVINLPTKNMIDTVAKIGNSSGQEINKFDQYNLTPIKARHVKAPMIAECYAHFECRLHDDQLVEDYNFFIFKVMKAHAARTPKYPETIHYMGDGRFMTAGGIIRRRSLFLPDRL